MEQTTIQVPPEYLKFSTNFVVMPGDCNYMTPMIFGGEFFARLDIAVACAVKRAMYFSDCDSAVTHKWEGEFHAPSYLGDIIFIDAEIVEFRHKAIVIKVVAHREPIHQKGIPKRILVASAKFVFVSRKGDQYAHHGLSMPVEE
jgi:acyl-CoA hydrolase